MALTLYAMTRDNDTDDDGSGTTGTILNNAWKQAFYQRIDDFFSDVGRGMMTGRIYPVTGQPSWAGNIASYTTLYFGPALSASGAVFAPGLISLYNGSKWLLYTFTEISLSLSGLTNGTTYDLFVYNNAGTLTMEAVAWSGSTTPSSTTTQDGIIVKTGAASKRFVGCIHINGGTGTLTVNASTNPIWNAYNQIDLALVVTEGASTWTYGSGTLRPWNNNTSNRVTHLTGRPQATGASVAQPVHVQFLNMIGCDAGEEALLGIGLNSTTTIHDECLTAHNFGMTGGPYLTSIATLHHLPPIGYNFYQALESSPTGTSGFAADGQHGLNTVVKC